MTNSKTTLMELTRQYRHILKKCFLLNLGIVLFATPANAMTISENYPITGNVANINEALSIEDGADVVLTNAGLVATDNITFSGNTKFTLKAQGDNAHSYLLLGQEYGPAHVMTITGDSVWNLEAPGRESEVEADIFGNIIVGSDSQWTINAPTRFPDNDADFHINGNFTLAARSTLTINHPMTLDDYEGVEFHADNLLATNATINLTGGELEAHSATVQESEVTINDGGIFGEGYLWSEGLTTLTVQNSHVDLIYSDLSIEREGENFFALMDKEEQEEFLEDIREFGTENLASNILGHVNYMGDQEISLPNGVRLSYDTTNPSDPKIVWKDSTGTQYLSWGEPIDTKLQEYLADVGQNITKLKQIHDALASIDRSLEASITLSASNITGEYASEIANELSGNMQIINGTTISLKKGKAYTSILGHQGTTGDIDVIDSTITLNENTSLIRGLYGWDETGVTLNPGVEMSEGDIDFKHSTLNMSGTAFVALSDTNGVFELYDGSELNVKGKNTIYLKNAADETQGAGSVALGFNDEGEYAEAISRINIDPGASLTLVTGNVGYKDDLGEFFKPIIYAGEHSEINISGILNGGVSTDGLLSLTRPGKINGKIYKATKIHLDGHAGDIKSILGNPLQDVEELKLSGPKSKYTLNNPMFSATDPEQIVYVNYMLTDPKDKWISQNIGALTPAQVALMDQRGKWCDENGMCYTRIDNQLSSLDITDGASFSTNKMLYASDGIHLDHGALFSTTAPIMTDSIQLSDGSKMSVSKLYFDEFNVGDVSAYNGSTVDFSNGEYLFANGYMENSTLIGKTDDMQMGSLEVTDASNVNLTASRVFAEELLVSNNTLNQKLTATLNNGTILSGHETTVSNVDMVLNNSTIGNQQIAIITVKPENISYVEYDKNGSSELTSIQNSRVTLNGNSSIKNTLLHEIESNKVAFTDLSPIYWAQNGERISSTLQGASLSGLNDFANNVELSNSRVTMNGTSSIANNSWNTPVGKGHINIVNNSVVNVLGKNTFTASSSVHLESGSTLNVAKGASLTVQDDWVNDHYTDNTIYLNNAHLVLAGTLNGSLNGWAYSVTLAPTTKIIGDVDLGGCIYGFGLSGVNNVKDGNKVFENFHDLATTADNVSLNTLTLDNSKLSASMLQQIHDNEYGIASDFAVNMAVQNKSVFTVDNMDNELPNVSPTNMTVADSTLNVVKGGLLETSALSIYDSAVTITGDATRVDAGITATTFSVENVLKPQSTLTLTNAILNVSGPMSLENANVKITGNAKNSTITRMEAGNIIIDNDANQKATVTVTSANLQASSNIELTNTSFTFTGNTSLLNTNKVNFIKANDFGIDNEYNTKANVTMSNGKVKANQFSICNTQNVKLTNMTIYDKNGGDTSNTYIRYGKNLTLSAVGTDDMAISVFDTVTFDRSGGADVGVSWVGKATVKKSDFDSLSLYQATNAIVSDTEIDGELKVWAMYAPVIDSKQKWTYSTNATITNTEIEGNLFVQKANVTIGKGNIVGGTLKVNTDCNATGSESAYVNVKENLIVHDVLLDEGTIEVAAGKTLTATDGFTMKNDASKLVLNGKIQGNINMTNTGSVIVSNNAAKMYVDVGDSIDFGSAGTLEFKNVKGTLNGFIPTANLTLHNLKLTNSTLTYDKDVNVGGDFTMTGSNLYLGTNTLNVTGEANIYDKSTIYVNVAENGAYGKLHADTINLQTNANGSPKNITLAVTLPKASQDNPSIVGHSFNFLDYNDVTGSLGNVTIANNRYTFTENNVGQFMVTSALSGKGVIERNASASPGVLAAAAAFVDTPQVFAAPRQATLANNLNTLSQVVGGEQNYIQALSATNPDSDAIVQTTALMSTDTLLDTSASRLSAGGSVAGLSAGDVVGNHGAMWGQALYNKTKLNSTASSQGFKDNSKGLALGAETNMTDHTKVGLAYAYTQNDIKSSYRQMDVDTHGLSLYGEYKPNNWFVNGVAGISWSDYDTQAWSTLGATNADFDVYTYSAQATTGYKFAVADNIEITPNAGLRYINFRQKSYTDSDDKRISATNADIWTAMAGSTFSASYATQNGTTWKPYAKLGVSYDFHSEASESIVSLSNGSAYYVPNRRLKRLGVTGGIGTEIHSGNWDFSIGYDVDARSEYRSHTGSLKAKYHF